MLDTQLSSHEFVAGDAYSIADIAIWPWYGALAQGRAYNAGEFLSVSDYKNVIRWADQIADRPAVQRGRIVNVAWGDGPQLRERHSAADIDEALAAQG